MRVAVLCEMSGRVRDAFRRKGHDAWSSDLYGPGDAAWNLFDQEFPEYHIQGDALAMFRERGPWDMVIAFPPCKYMANSANKHLYVGQSKANGICAERWQSMLDGVDFFNEILRLPVGKMVVENSVMSGHAKKRIDRPYDQIIQPWHHGVKEQKQTCLWLKGVTPLQPSNVVGPPPPAGSEERKTWEKCFRMAPGPYRDVLRAVTSAPVAAAMANQWG